MLPEPADWSDWGDNVTAMNEDKAHSGRALVVVIDDEVDAHPDTIGALVSELLAEDGFIVDAVVGVRSDVDEIRHALETAVVGGVDAVITLGGTGAGLRDVTPEATEEILDKRLLGIEQAIRFSAIGASVMDAVTSRGVAGISGSTVIVNIASSRAAVRDGMSTVAPLVAFVVNELSADFDEFDDDELAELGDSADFDEADMDFSRN